MSDNAEKTPFQILQSGNDEVMPCLLYTLTLPTSDLV